MDMQVNGIEYKIQKKPQTHKNKDRRKMWNKWEKRSVNKQYWDSWKKLN